MRGRIYHSLIYSFIYASLILGGNAWALESDFRGQLSGWTMAAKEDSAWATRFGLRYVPQLTLKKSLGHDSFFDFELSLNGFMSTGSGESADESDLKLYRAKVRYATAQTETRAGLQQLNFGPARLLRALRWFDRLDPTDPLKLTEGVHALRFKYDALNNAGFWFWVLYDNDEPKGYETLATESGRPEFGGRLVYPAGDGELAATLHTRRVDGARLNVPDYTEARLALDGHWDIGIGLWFESVFQHQEAAFSPYDWAKMMTVGLDYTFGIGNGLYVLFEHMAAVLSDRALGWDEETCFSAFLLQYPLGFIDNLKIIGYYSWEEEQFYKYFSWERTYDALVLNLSLFHYPDTAGDGFGFQPGPAFGEYGVQFMVIFNH